MMGTNEMAHANRRCARCRDAARCVRNHQTDEHEQWMIAGAGVMAVPDALRAVGRAHARILCRGQCLSAGAGRAQGRSNSQTKSARKEKFAGAASHCVSKRPTWLGEAALPCAALPPTIQRIAGSWRGRSASFTPSYPARRPKLTAATNQPAHGDRSCRCAHRRASRPPSCSARVRRRVHGMPTIRHRT